MRHFLTALALMACPVPVSAQDVHFLGETHDNPGHHVRQAERVTALQPKALVFEMLTPEQAALVSPELRTDRQALQNALGWDDTGWPDFAMYFPIFEAAPDALIFGAAVPREDARRIMSEPVGAIFGADAARYSLDQPLPAQQQDAREAMQLSAHCDALPVEMLPMMVNMQRLRDAALARAVIAAFDQTGGPVAVITGNGHARKDWGAPAVLAAAQPDLTIMSLGQGETGNGAPSGDFDEIAFSAPAPREDPCAAFQ